MHPFVLNLLAAERIVLDRPTGRCDLHGVLHELALPLPNRITFAVYYVLGSVHEPFDLSNYFDGPDDERLGGGKVKIAISDPLAIVQGSAQFDVVIERSGRYRMKLECRGEFLAERPMLVAQPG